MTGVLLYPSPTGVDNGVDSAAANRRDAASFAHRRLFEKGAIAGRAITQGFRRDDAPAMALHLAGEPA